MSKALRLVSLGTDPIGYSDWLALQSCVVSARQSGRICDTVFFLEHRPVITLGRSSKDERWLLTDRAALIGRGIEVLDAGRGGDITYHAPGQLIVYPIIDLDCRGRDLHAYIRALERCTVDTLAELGVDSHAVSGLTGVWTDAGKVAAIGIKVSRWVTSHGLAVNNTLDLAPMRRDIVPCGLAGKEVTSMAELGAQIPQRTLADALGRHLCRTLFQEPAMVVQMEESTLQDETERHMRFCQEPDGARRGGG